MGTFTIRFVNFGYSSAREPLTLEGAKRVCRDAGFQSAVHDPSGKIVGTWCPTAGWRDVR